MMGREVSQSIDIMKGAFQDTEKVKIPDYRVQNRMGACFEQVRAQ